MIPWLRRNSNSFGELMRTEFEVEETPQANETVHSTADGAAVDRLAKGAGISLVGVGLGRGLDFVKQIAMARLLGPEAFGLYAIGWNFLRIIGILIPLGLHNGVVHFATAHWRTEDGVFKSIVVRSVGISFAIGWVATAILFFLAPWITTSLFKEPEYLPLFRLFLFMLPFMSALRVAANASRISQRMQYSVASEEIAQATVNLVLFFAFYAIGWELFGAILSTVLSFAAGLALAVYYLYRLFGPAMRSTAISSVSNRQLLSYSVPTALSGMFGVIISRVDRLFLGYYWPAADVGVYQAAAQLSVIMAIVLNAFNMILTPMIAEQYHRDNKEQLEELFRVNTKWGIYCVVPLVLVIMFAAEDIMTVLFGEAYIGGATALQILTVGQFINIATGATGIMLIMTGHQQQWFRLSMAIVVINLILNLTLIPRWGIEGAAVATATTVGGLFAIGLLIVRHVLHMWPYDRRYVKGLIAATATALALLGVAALSLSPVPSLILSAAVSGGVFIGLLLLLGLDAEDKAFIQLIQKRIRPA